MAYEPKPIDTSHVSLSDELVELIELLAGNVHEHWARRRLGEGWRHGPKPDPDAKVHPGLVPYEALSESEKEYDRTTVTETLKAIVALGYRIEKG